MFPKQFSIEEEYVKNPHGMLKFKDYLFDTQHLCMSQRNGMQVYLWMRTAQESVLVKLILNKKGTSM